MNILLLRRCIYPIANTFNNNIIRLQAVNPKTRFNLNMNSFSSSSRCFNLMACNNHKLPYKMLFGLPQSFVTKRMASKKAKKKKGNSIGKGTPKIDVSVGDGIFDLKKLKIEMELSIEKLQIELSKRFSPNLTIGIIDNFYISIDGKSSLLYELAEVKAQDNEFIITPMIKGKNIEKQIINSIDNTGLNLRPRINDKVISITKPVSSVEYKTNLLNLSKSSAEKSKSLLRKTRQQALSTLKKVKDASKDEVTRIEKQIELLTESSNLQVDKLFSEKKSELGL